MKIIDTAYAPLYHFGEEAPDYGLYSYVILPGAASMDRDRDRTFIRMIVESTPAAVDVLTSWHDHLNLLLLPANGCGVRPRGSRESCVQETPADIERHYDYRAARVLLYRLCKTPINSMVSFCNSAFGRGPFLFTYAHPASTLEAIAPPILFVDLSSVEPEAFAEYIAAYKEQVKSDDITDGKKINTIRLKILSLIMIGKGLINPVEKALGDIIHVSELDK